MARLETLSAWFVLLFGWKRYLAAFAAGLLSAFSLAPFDFFPVLFVTIPSFIWLMDGVYADGKNGRIAAIRTPFLTGWWFGFGFFLMGFWWVGSAFLIEAENFVWALPFAVLLLPTGLAIFWGVAGVIARILWSDHWARCFAFAFAFGALEYIRGFLFTGLPWNTPGYAAMFIPALMQSASVIGLYGVTLLTFLVCALPLTALATPAELSRSRTLPLVLAGGLILAHAGFGIFRLSQHPTEYIDEISFRLIQPDIDQGAKMDPASDEATVKSYLDLSTSTSPSGKAGLEGTRYLIWPESAFPFLLTERRDVLSAIGDILPDGTQLITGAMRAEPGIAGNPYGIVYNSMFLIADNGEIVEAADKTHLVPFGEYLPYQSALEAMGLEQLTRLRGGFEAGAERKLLAQSSAYPFLPLICYEIIFSGEVRPKRNPAVEPKWIVNLTNDGWFGYTPGPYQHLRQAVVRAVETGLPLVRVANTGKSVVTDPVGRILQELKLGEKGVIDSRLPKSVESTIFDRFGHIPFYFLLGLSLIVGLTVRRVKSFS